MRRTGGVPSLGRWKERVRESCVEERRVGVEGALSGAVGRERGEGVKRLEGGIQTEPRMEEEEERERHSPRTSFWVCEVLLSLASLTTSTNSSDGFPRL